MTVEIADPPSGITTLIEIVSPAFTVKTPVSEFEQVRVPPGAIDGEIVQVVLPVALVEMSVK